jgi:hypothetical protein
MTNARNFADTAVTDDKREALGRCRSLPRALLFHQPEPVGHALGALAVASLVLCNWYVRCTPETAQEGLAMDDPRKDRDPIEAEESTPDPREALQGIPGEPRPDIIDVEEEGLDAEDVEALEEMDDPRNE